MNELLPDDLKGVLPTIEELEVALEREAKKFEQPLHAKIKTALNEK
jgi:hypothetical protein